MRNRWLWVGVACGLGIAALLTLGGILGWLKWHENELVFATALSHAGTVADLPPDSERVTIAEAQGASIAGVILRADALSNSGFWVLHLHGNAASTFSAGQLRHCVALRSMGLNVLSIDYRGFGPSAGIASERHIYEDAEAAYQALIQRAVPANRIIIWGHSLGSGPAVYLATQHPAAALVLFGAFTSVPDAAADNYPHLPVRWIVGIGFDSLSRMPEVHIPVLIAHSVNDAMLPFHDAQRLYAAAREPKRLLALNVPATDSLGGHVNALYDHLDLLLPELAALGVAIEPPPRNSSMSPQ